MFLHLYVMVDSMHTTDCYVAIWKLRGFSDSNLTTGYHAFPSILF